MTGLMLRGHRASTAGGFYQAAGSSSAEAARLRRMAGAADVVSLAALGPLVDRPGVVVADIAAGDSTSLGIALTARNRSLQYVPIDIRQLAVDAHRLHGFDGRVGSATDLPIGDATVDIVHARFLLAWLDRRGRRRAVEEMLRVGAGGSRLAIIDYDWDSAAGPEPLLAWKDKLLTLLVGFGFNPYYGQCQAVELRRHLSDAGLDPADYSLCESRFTATEPFREALATIDETVAPVVERLTTLGLTEDVDELASLHAEVIDHARRHPDTAITFPTIAATTVDFTSPGTLSAVATAIGNRCTTQPRSDPTSQLQHAGPAELGVYLLADDLIDEARRLHAAEYLGHGNLTDDSIDDDGFLIASIDPPDVIARSTYLGVLDDEGHVGGCMRMIRPADNDMTTLPTVAKLLAAREPKLSDLPISTGSAVREVSGLARSSRIHDRTVTTRLILAVMSEAHRCGDDYVVMGIVSNVAKHLIAIYGPQAIRPMDHALGTITVSGAGIQRSGVTLIPCYAQTTTFLDDLLQHCQTRPDDELTRLNQGLVELTAVAWAHNGPRR